MRATKKAKQVVQVIASIALIVLSIAFAATNLQKVEISYFFGSSELYVCVLVFVALLMGGLIGVFFRFPAYHRLKRENVHLHKKLENAQQPESDLRAIPLQK